MKNMENLAMEIGIVDVVKRALTAPAFKLSDRMAGESVTVWKNRRSSDLAALAVDGVDARFTDAARLGVKSGDAAFDRVNSGARRGEEFARVSGAIASVTKSALARGVAGKYLDTRDVRAAERIYKLSRMAEMGGPSLTTHYGERVSGGEQNYERAVGAELAYRAVMAALPGNAREFIRRVIVEAEPAGNVASRFMRGAANTAHGRSMAAKVFLQVGLNAAATHFDEVGWS